MMMSRAKIRIWCAALLLSLISTFGPENAPAQNLNQNWKQIIVKCSPEDLDRIRAEVGLAVVDSISGYYLVNVSYSVDSRRVESILGRGPIEASDNGRVFLGRRQVQNQNQTRTVAPPTLTIAPPTLSTLPRSAGPVVSWYGAPARLAYTAQWAGPRIHLQDALQIATGNGIRVAIIDTGVDEKHATLKPVLVPGKNYVGRTQVPDELDDPAILAQSTSTVLDQSTSTVLDQSTSTVLDQSTSTVLDQSTSTVLDQSTSTVLDQVARKFPEYGHGTEMAGLIHYVAPNARIIPLKAFDASGAATEWNIVRAIYDAVDMRADVISMSFSSITPSKMIEKAVQYAFSRGVILVASTGNDNSEIPTYPSSYESAIAVSAVDLYDNKASFSNYGKYVDVSAPGVNLVTTYPGGRFALVSGTSDSAPLVAGIVALVKERGNNGAYARARVENSVDSFVYSLPQYRDKLGKGRINAYKAVTR